MNEARTAHLSAGFMHVFFYLYKGHLETDLTVCGLITIETQMRFNQFNRIPREGNQIKCHIKPEVQPLSIILC